MVAERRWYRIALAAGLTACCSVLGCRIGAQPPRPLPTAPAPDAGDAQGPDEEGSRPEECTGRIDEAKRLNDEGVEALAAGDHAACADLFLRSFEACPDSGNALNAAYCLDQAGRSDEALHLYKITVVRFDADILTNNLKIIGDGFARLPARVATFVLSSNVDGYDIDVDGVSRPFLRGSRILHVLPGTRRLRFRKEGFQEHEVTEQAVLGEPRALDVSLKPTGAWVRVEPRGAAARLFNVLIDGQPVGPAPWAGPLIPGEHLFQLEGAELGSVPRRAVARAGETRLVRLPVAKLGRQVTIEVEPATADLSLGAARLGKGAWSGRLPEGEYTFRAEEAGFEALEERFATTGPSGPLHLRRKLVRDDSDPRWATAGHFWLEASVGAGLGGTLGSLAESSCSGEWACSAGEPALGVTAAARGGFELTSRFPRPVSLAIQAGYFYSHTAVQRSYGLGSDPAGSGEYRLNDDVTLEGGLLAGGLGVSWITTDRHRLSTSLLAGALIASSRDAVRAEVQWGGATSGARLFTRRENELGDGLALVSGLPFPMLVLLPEVSAALRLSQQIELGLGLGAIVFLTDGPAIAPTDVGLDDCEAGSCPPPVSVAGRGAEAEASHRAPFAFFSPRVFLSYAFR